LRPLLHDFRARIGIEVTESEIAELRDYMPLDRKTLNEIVLAWKTDRALYQTYRGPVIFNQGNPFEPVGAYRALLKDAEQQGNLRVVHGRVRSALDEYYTAYLGAAEIPPEKVDFSRPVWQMMKEAGVKPSVPG